MTRTSVLIVEDNGLLAGELQLVADEHGLLAKEPAHSYLAALKAIDAGGFDCCVLDLNLGKFTADPFGPGREGRQLLALLGTKKIPTVVYSGHVSEEKTIRALHPDAVCIDKLESCERVVEALLELCCDAET
ncbi:response regulator [Marinovum sp.]|uniref:response regulator n=1 Tax=Marinovum sp. TaxID=2024839 RepID=UPI002B27430F|nr:response regulator [Marinovum sp.]